MRRLLLLGFVGIVLVALAVSTVPFALFIESVERDRLLTTLERDAFVLAGKAEEALESLSVDDLTPVRKLASEYRDAGGARVVIVDKTGRAVVTNDPEENRVGLSYLSRPEFDAALGGAISTGERFSKTLGVTLVYIAVPVFSGTEIVGAVRMTFDEAVIDAEVRRQWGGIAIVALTTLALGVALAFVLSGTLARGLRELGVASDGFAAGDFTVRARENVGPSDVQALARAFNAMGERVAHLVEQQQRFSSDASHQLRTPITALMLRIDALRDSASVSPKSTEQFEAIEAELARLNRLIDGLLALGRAGADTVTPVTVDASAILSERVTSWGSLADEAGITITASLPPGLHVRAVPQAVEHITDVYLDNAFSVSSPGDIITIELEERDDRVVLRVLDRGPGVSAEVAERAFDRFWRGGSSYEGSGLGLAIVKQVADSSGATVSLEARDGGGAVATASFMTPA